MTSETILRMLSMGDFELEVYFKGDYDERYLNKIAKMKAIAADGYEVDLYKRLCDLEDFIKQRMPKSKPYKGNNNFFSQN
jgi:hypothetical protein